MMFTRARASDYARRRALRDYIARYIRAWLRLCVVATRDMHVVTLMLH